MSTILLAATNFFGGFEHTTQDHGVSDWICMESGTVTYSVPYAGTNIIESNVDGSSETTRVSNAAAGARGTFSITAGKLYHGSNAINLFCEGEHHRIVPITNKGTKFGHYARRSTPTTYYAYNPNPTPIRIDVYDAVSGGISGTPTNNFTVHPGTVYSLFTNSRTSAWVLFESVDGDAVMSASQNGADRSLMYPADTNTYIRKSNRTIIWTDMLNSAPASSSTYTAADATNLVLGHTYADGAGGDDENAVGLNYLADRYSFGNAIGDYFIAAPYASTTATVKYWNGSSFATYATYSLNGSLTSPAVVQVGTARGNGSNLQGGATHWMWEANNPIFVAINDTVADEESMLGWMANRTSSGSTRNGVITAESVPTDQLALHLDATNQSSYSGGTAWNDLSGNGYNFTLSNASAFTAGTGSTPPHMNFESQICRRLVSGSMSNVPNATNGTIVIFSTIKNTTSTWRTLVRGSSSGPDHHVIIESGSNDLGMYDNQSTTFLDAGFDINSVPNYTTKFNMHAWKLSQSSPYYQYFYNTNTSSASGTITNANATFNNGFSAIGGYHNNSNSATNTGQQHWGKIMVFLYYQKHLSSSELDAIYNYYQNTAIL